MRSLPATEDDAETHHDFVVHIFTGKHSSFHTVLAEHPSVKLNQSVNPDDVIGFNLVEELELESSTLKRFNDGTSTEETSRV